MSDMDVLRIICEFHTVTAEDMADGLEMTLSGAHAVLQRLMAKKLIERVRVERCHLYAVTAKGRKVESALPSINPSERCLLLVKIQHTERYIYLNGTPVLDTSEDDCGTVFEPLSCDYCGSDIYGPFRRCSNCGAGGLG